MADFRGDDATLDREIETLEGVARRRLRRMNREMRDLDRDLRELRRERARRRAAAVLPAAVPSPAELADEAR
jgi:transposase InsO family protein